MANAIEQRTQRADADGFDIDAVLDADIILPERLASPVTIEDLDRMIRPPDQMPPGINVQLLAPQEYRLLAPGMSERLRVTTDPAYNEEHAENKSSGRQAVYCSIRRNS